MAITLEPNAPPRKLAVGLQEAEQLIGVSMHTLRRLVWAKKLSAARIGRRMLIPMAELEKLVNAGADSGPIRKSRKAG